MAGYGTKKPFGDRGVQLTFPLEFQKAYHLGSSYFPSDQGLPPDIMMGSDFQSSYHQQKRLDANKVVMDGLQARKSAERKLLTGVHNYHLPRPVLGQRRYANPSYGADQTSSARRDSGTDAPFRLVDTTQMSGSGHMRGGVLKTREGQEFYRRQLDNRIEQLNRLDALAQGYAVEMGQSYQTQDNTKEGSPNKVEFFIYLRALSDALLTGDLSRFSFENFKEMISLLFRFAPTATREDFKDLIKEFDQILETARDGLLEVPTFAQKPQNVAYSTSMVEYLERLNKYIDQMYGNVDRSEQEKTILSKSLIKSLGFDSVFKTSTPERFVVEATSGRASLFSEGLRNRMEDFDGFFGGDDDDGSGDGGGGGGGSWFGFSAPSREDEELRGIPRAPFAGRSGDPARERYGRETGRRTRGDASFYGEDMDSAGLVGRDRAWDEAPYLAYPLGAAGFDPSAMGSAPAVDHEQFRRAVEDEISSVLRPLGFSGDVEDVEEFVNEQYPDPKTFVREVVSGLEEKTYTPAQIAQGMDMVDLPFFSDYIAEHSGDVAPAPALPARAGVGALGGVGALPPPVYRPYESSSEGSTTTAPAGSGYATAEDWAELERLGFPRHMTGMAQFKTAREIATLMRKLPAKWGGPVNMRTDERKNAMAYVRRIFQKIDPKW